MPELRHLRVFAAVAEQLSFTRAAELLHMTQQTVSRTVSELERELGVTLLERTTREVRLTPAGDALLAEVQPLGGAGEVELLGHGHERPQLAQLRHPRRPRRRVVA